jgi:hypothetical protein
MTKSACAIINVAQSLLKTDSVKHGGDTRNYLDAIYMLSHADTALSMQRREQLRPGPGIMKLSSLKVRKSTQYFVKSLNLNG